MLIFPFKLIIGAAVLLGILYKVAKHEADFSFGKALMIIGGLTFISVILSSFLGALLGFVGTFAAGVGLVSKLMYVSYDKAAMAMAAYTGVQILLGMLLG